MAIKWKQGIGYGESGGAPHLVSSDGRFEIYKYEKHYNLRRYMVSRGYELRDNHKTIGKSTFQLLRDAKKFAEELAEHAPAMPGVG